jgi:hypothetical protein
MEVGMDERKDRAMRAKYLKLGERVGGSAPDNDNAPAFTVTRGELGRMVREAVEGALAERQAPPALLDREGLGLALGCSSSQVDKMRRAGMPCVRIGDSPRIELERCLGWLRKDGAA